MAITELYCQPHAPDRATMVIVTPGNNQCAECGMPLPTGEIGFEVERKRPPRII